MKTYANATKNVYARRKQEEGSVEVARHVHLLVTHEVAAHQVWITPGQVEGTAAEGRFR